MQIGELSRRTGVSVRMLRYYEREHLLQPARRASGYRDYGEDDVRLVERIRALSAAGLTLSTARVVLPCVDDQGQRFQPCKEVRPALEREMHRISDKIATLEKSRQVLMDYLSEAG